jgi:NAD(P)-dependent dehydrogenase (short-subunit alcohol dehydrogenase family)
LNENLVDTFHRVYQLSKHKPARIYLAARSKAKAEQAIDDITRFAPDHAPISFLELDLTSFESIKSAAKSFIASNDRLDILVNNAGIMACPAGLTYEIQFGTNHVGHALLTKLLLPVLQRTAEYQPTGSVRIVNVSSGSESFAPVPAGIEFEQVERRLS